MLRLGLHVGEASPWLESVDQRGVKHCPQHTLEENVCLIAKSKLEMKTDYEVNVRHVGSTR